MLWYVSRRFPLTGKEQAKPHRVQPLDHVMGAARLGDHDDDPIPQAAKPQRQAARGLCLGSAPSGSCAVRIIPATSPQHSAARAAAEFAPGQGAQTAKRLPTGKTRSTPGRLVDAPWSTPRRSSDPTDNEKALISRAFHGAKRIRTADLLGAIQALSQLSYSPANAQYIERQAGPEPGRTGIPSCLRAELVTRPRCHHEGGQQRQQVRRPCQSEPHVHLLGGGVHRISHMGIRAAPAATPFRVWA